MNNVNSFIFNNETYYLGAIVKIKEEWIHLFKFNSILCFTGYSVDEKVYCFSSLQDIWSNYKLSNEQINEYIEKIFKEELIISDNNVKPEYIENIVSAWIWYILIMFFALFFKGIENIIITWIITTLIFFNWRHGKIKGG